MSLHFKNCKYLSSMSSNSLHNIFWIKNKSSLCWFRVEGSGHQLLVCYLVQVRRSLYLCQIVTEGGYLMNQWWTKHDENGVEIWKYGDFSAFMVMGLNMQVCFGNDFCVLFMLCDAMDLKLKRVEFILFYGYGCRFWVWCVVGTVTFLGVNVDD